MDVVSHCPLPVAGRVWSPRPGAFVLTFVCKATFTLAPGRLALAPEQQPVHELDRSWSESVQSLYAAADLAPRKLRADVALIGNAYAPEGRPVQQVVARLEVGDSLDKRVQVWCDRTLRADGSVVDGPYFTQLPLLYERASGGPGTENPVGMTPTPDAYGSLALPNLTPPGARMSADGRFPSIGFGPIGSRWPSRLSRLGRHADELTLGAWHERPLPPDLDMAYFNMAPADQQIPALHADERISLSNLHREHPELHALLPGLRPRAQISGPGGERSAAMSCDTLWIDTSRDICCLTYRGQVLLSSPSEAGWVVVTLEGGEPEEIGAGRRPQAGENLTGTLGIEEDTTATPSRARPASTMTLPFAAKRHTLIDRGVPSTGLPFQAAGEASARRADRPEGGGLPFRRDPPAAPPPPTALATGAPPAGIQMGGLGSKLQQPLGPPSSVAAAPASYPAWSPPAPPAPVPSAAPPGSMIIPAPAAAAASDSPWATRPAAVGVGTIAPVVAAPAAVPLAPGDFRAGGGALVASNAAAGVVEARSAPRGPEAPMVVPVTAPRPAPPKEPADTLDLIFFDAAALPRIRRVPAWKKILAALDDRPLDAEEDDPAAAKDPQIVEDRREVFELLLRAQPSDAAAIDEALVRSVREDGRFFAPIVLVSGELTTPFDEIETLKATMTTATPLAGNDENLRASLEVAKDFLKLPGLSSSPAVAEGLTNRVRDAFEKTKRAVAPGYLDAQTERALVDQRFYQHRKVLGGRRQRALFHFVAGAREGLAAYLPAEVAPKLPLHARFKARMIARVHLPLDAHEQGCALEALALGRLCPSPRRDPK